MKYLLLIIFLIVVFAFFLKKKEELNVIEEIDIDSIQMGEIKHDSLSAEQLDKINIIHNTFKEVFPVSLEKTITNFKRDKNPDNEINIWLAMHNAFQKYKTKFPNTTLDLQKEIFKLLLTRSSINEKETLESMDYSILSKGEAIKVLSYYTHPPKPITIIKK